MKKILILVTLLSFNLTHANISEKCNQPSGEYTDLLSVLNQFVFNDGNPNWGDWCYELSSGGNECVKELNNWDSWLVCTKEGYTAHCKDYADKEGFASSEKEYDAFIAKCVQDNYRALLD